MYSDRCVTPGNATYLGNNNRQVAFIVQMSQQSIGGISLITQYFSTIIRDIQLQHPRWFNTFYLVAYNSTCQ